MDVVVYSGGTIESEIVFSEETMDVVVSVDGALITSPSDSFNAKGSIFGVGALDPQAIKKDTVKERNSNL